MNLEHCRKEAKGLARAAAAGDPHALARAEAVLGGRARKRFLLSDAQHVVAVERGYPSWRALLTARRFEQEVDTGLEYRPGDPIRVWVIRREHRIAVSDRASALARAGVSLAWRPVADRLARELVVNIGGSGAVWLPVVRSGPGETAIINRIAHASLSFYQDLLDLEETNRPLTSRRA